MKRIISLATVALLTWIATAGAGVGPSCHGPTCITPPQSCPDCSCPCDGHRFSLGLSAEHALADLQCGECCHRIRAAKKLGLKICHDFCKDCSILPALVHALLVDSCWEVRKAAAWSIALQGARTDLGLTALYVSSKLDPHYMVRDKAIMAWSSCSSAARTATRNCSRRATNWSRRCAARNWCPAPTTRRRSWRACRAAPPRRRS